MANNIKEPTIIQPRGLGLPGYVVETISGLTAGFLSTVTVHPLDMVKTRLQVDRTIGPPKLGTTLDLLRKIATTEGSAIKGWYRGFMPNLLGNMSGWAIYFAAYEELKSYVSSRPDRSSPNLSGTEYLLCASGGGAFTAALTNPFWVIKTRMLATSAKTPGAYVGFLDGFRSILREDGPRGLMRGYLVGLFGVGHSAVQFLFYEKLKQWRVRDGRQLNSVDYVTLSGTAKITASALTYPYRVIQARIQNTNRRGYYKGLVDTVWKIALEEGYRGFYKGLAPGLVRVLPSTCITFLVYENARRYLR